MIHELHELLQRAGRRVRSLRLWSSLAVCWLAWALVVYGLARLADRLAWNWSTAWAALAGATAISALVCWRLAARAGRDPRRLAQLIEATHPELGAMLLTALEQAPTPKFRRLGYLQTSVVRGAVLHGRSHNWADATSRGRVRLARLAHLMALAALVSSWSLLVHRTGDAARAAATGGAADLAPPGALDVEIQPGDAEIERGATLLVIARFRSAMPPQAELVVSPARAPGAAAAARPESLAMTRSLDDPQFVGRVSDVAADLTYHVAYAGRRSRAYRITVFDYPELRRADARLQFPSYPRLEPKTLQDVRQLTAVQGTQLTLTFRLNKPVAAAQLVDRSGQTVELSPVDLDRPAGEATYQWVTTLAESQRLQLRLVDDAGRKNRLPPEFVINVTPNNPPEIKIQRPGRDVRVSPVEELDLRTAL
ncbi:MAG TPA: hypothetical protein PKC18_19285, partial [Lacipirellulaceae bacterium]|nr:hypothetical protein [Lacipirellulaceae bacterium]